MKNQWFIAENGEALEPGFNIEKEKKAFIENMNKIKEMNVQEATLYKKWSEIRNEYKDYIDTSTNVRGKIWRPRNLLDKQMTKEDFDNLDPIIAFVEPTNAQAMNDWLILRVFVHSMDFVQNPGRFLRFLIIDKTSGKYLGAASLGSDVMSIGCRDKWIGWTKENKVDQHKLNHTAIATTIMGTQPFGYNFLGGKLVASLMTTKVVQDAWNTLYPETLVGITTTSLYGSHSMYQRIPYWREMGETIGKIFVKPEDSAYKSWHHYIQEKYPEQYKESTTSKNSDAPATGIKQKILSLIMKEVGMIQSHYSHGFTRGVFYAPLFENTKEFLCNQITEKELLPNKKLQGDRKEIVRWWREKAWNRYENLHSQGRLNPGILFYNKLLTMKWEDVQKEYLPGVGKRHGE